MNSVWQPIAIGIGISLIPWAVLVVFGFFVTRIVDDKLKLQVSNRMLVWAFIGSLVAGVLCSAGSWRP